jgi:predicted phage gp36 major capsid-like protein
MRNAEGCTQLGDACAGERLVNALRGLQASLQNMTVVETEMKERFESFRRALNQISDNAREIAEHRELRGAILSETPANGRSLDSPTQGVTRAAYHHLMKPAPSPVKADHRARQRPRLRLSH